MFEILIELLGYVRKLLPLMELYVARRPAQPARDTATQEFQAYTAELLRSNRTELMELRSVLEGLNQRLKVIDEQSVALQRELSRMANRQRAMLVVVVISAVISAAALIAVIVAHR